MLKAQPETVRAYVEETISLCRQIWPDLSFIEAGGRLVVNGLETKARFLRLGLTSPGILKLRWIEIYAGSGSQAVNIAPQGVLSLSSTVKHAANLLENGLFLRPHGEPYGVHTKKDQWPWVCVDLKQAVDLRSLVLVNQDNNQSTKAANLVIEASLDGEDWRTIYSHAESKRTCSQALAERRRISLGEPAMALRQVIDEIIVEVFSAEYKAANALLRGTPGLAGELRSAIALPVTEHILARRSLEWTNHTISRTFRYWSTEEKAAYLRIANQVVEDLITLGYDACLGFGSVLSIVRDQDFVKHDDDLDVIVSLPRQAYATLGAGLDEIGAELVKKGYKVSGEFVSHRHVSRNGRKNLDVFAGFVEDDFVSWLPGPRRVLYKSDVFPGSQRSLFGVDCIIPRDPTRYLEAVYGPDWKVPISRWNHNWNRKVYADWFTSDGVENASLPRQLSASLLKAGWPIMSSLLRK